MPGGLRAVEELSARQLAQTDEVTAFKAVRASFPLNESSRGTFAGRARAGGTGSPWKWTETGSENKEAGAAAAPAIRKKRSIVLRAWAAATRSTDPQQHFDLSRSAAAPAQSASLVRSFVSDHWLTLRVSELHLVL